MEIDYRAIAGAVLIACGVGVGLWKQVPVIWRGLAQPNSVRGSTPPVALDTHAAADIQAYLDMVLQTAPKADAETRWGYAYKNMSMLDVLLAERDRLGGGP